MSSLFTLNGDVSAVGKSATYSAPDTLLYPVSETDDGFLPVDISGPRINVLFAHFAPVELNEFHRLFGIHVAVILQLSEHHDFLDLQGGCPDEPSHCVAPREHAGPMAP